MMRVLFLKPREQYKPGDDVWIERTLARRLCENGDCEPYADVIKRQRERAQLKKAQEAAEREAAKKKIEKEKKKKAAALAKKKVKKKAISRKSEKSEKAVIE